MQVHVLPRGVWPTGSDQAVYLLTDLWDDFGFKTTFTLIVFDASGGRHDIGQVKIGRLGMATGERTELESSFDQLEASYFSLGQDDTYYENLNALGAEIRAELLAGLRDVAADDRLFERVRNEDVMTTSLLRSVSPASVSGQYRRIATGGARLTNFEFEYRPPATAASALTPALRFEVEPHAQPPSNIHVLTGRNGAGKTRTLHLMSRAFVEPYRPSDEVGVLAMTAEGSSGSRGFTNLVSVAFSAFDPFEPISPPSSRATGTQYVYVGLRRENPSDSTSTAARLLDTSELSKQFAESLQMCKQGARRERWLRAIGFLQSDPLFLASDLPLLIQEEPAKAAATAFSQLSSGHKIVLITLTRLVEAVDERTLVLIDEPESHLHPPLLSALVRSLSDLLTDRNGVAIVATHSPVVLQEVPRSCVWKLQRSGMSTAAARPDIETFGENIGVLTREVFGLEVTESGFHKLISDLVAEGLDFDTVVHHFNDQLGREGRAIVQALLAQQ